MWDSFSSSQNETWLPAEYAPYCPSPLLSAEAVLYMVLDLSKLPRVSVCGSHLSDMLVLSYTIVTLMTAHCN